LFWFPGHTRLFLVSQLFVRRRSAQPEPSHRFPLEFIDLTPFMILDVLYRVRYLSWGLLTIPSPRGPSRDCQSCRSASPGHWGIVANTPSFFSLVLCTRKVGSPSTGCPLFWLNWCAPPSLCLAYRPVIKFYFTSRSFVPLRRASTFSGLYTLFKIHPPWTYCCFLSQSSAIISDSRCLCRPRETGTLPDLS